VTLMQIAIVVLIKTKKMKKLLKLDILRVPVVWLAVELLSIRRLLRCHPKARAKYSKGPSQRVIVRIKLSSQENLKWLGNHSPLNASGTLEVTMDPLIRSFWEQAVIQLWERNINLQLYSRIV
jgi:hypothetical protein